MWWLSSSLMLSFFISQSLLLSLSVFLRSLYVFIFLSFSHSVLFFFFFSFSLSLMLFFYFLCNLIFIYFILSIFRSFCLFTSFWINCFIPISQPLVQTRDCGCTAESSKNLKNLRRILWFRVMIKFMRKLYP